MMGYLLTVVVISIQAVGTEHRLTSAAEGLFPASVYSQHALSTFRLQIQQYQDAVLLGEPDLFKGAAANAEATASALAALAALPGISPSRHGSALLMASRHAQFTRQAASTYAALEAKAPDEVTRETAAALAIASQKLTAQLEAQVAGCADDLRHELDSTVAATRRQRIESLVVFVVVVATSSVMVVLVITRWTRRLRTLMQASDRMAQGDFSKPIADSLGDEVGRLSRSFAIMQDTVQARRVELERFNDGLEQTVRERTTQLSARNLDLVKEIQDRERAELSLRLLESAVNQIADAVMITAPGAGISACPIVYANPAFTAITGHSRESLQGRHPDLLFGARTDREAMDQLFAELIAGHNAAVEAVNYRADGTEVFLEWNAAPLRNDAGELVNLVAVLRDITQRKRVEAEMEQMHRQLLDVSRQAGMAEVATGVLHNVGNVLNSVNVSATVVSDRMRESKLGNLAKAVDLLREHAADLPAFLASDPRGKQLPLYLIKLSEHVTGEREAIIRELKTLTANIEHIKEVVSLQQSYAKSSGFTQSVRPREILEEALRLNASSFQRHDIQVDIDCGDLPELPLDKHKILQILINLTSNSRHALAEISGRERRIGINVAQRAGRLLFTVSDNGTGISPENLQRVFAHGFTTKQDGHGFGLHSCALAAKEMGGTLTVHSDGPGRGAAFTLDIPIAAAGAIPPQTGTHVRRT
jgi:PAS domain S-box-containing protein